MYNEHGKVLDFSRCSRKFLYMLTNTTNMSLLPFDGDELCIRLPDFKHPLSRNWIMWGTEAASILYFHFHSLSFPPGVGCLSVSFMCQYFILLTPKYSSTFRPVCCILKEQRHKLILALLWAFNAALFGAQSRVGELRRV
ncbi:hypothetical protein EDB19DRAFT_1122520 [Suillus lakei]|nr:hypothetical protein EDB19DRAFT_1122520 [Suillus lakei]